MTKEPSKAIMNKSNVKNKYIKLTSLEINITLKLFK